MRTDARRFCVAVFALVWSAAMGASPAAAQDGVLDMTGMGIYAMEESVMQAARETVARPRRAAPAPSTAASANAKLTYQPSKQRQRANAARFVAKARSRDPKGAALLERQLADHDVIGQMERAMAGYGLRANDVADAYAAWWLNAWLASRGRSDNPSPRQIAAVRAQAAQAMTQAGLGAASDAVRQEVAEAHLIQAALIGAHMASAQGDAEKVRRMGAAVVQGAKTSGLDLRAMTLTDEGFVPAKR